MEERRSPLEWIFDTVAGIGLVTALLSILFRDRYPNFDVAAIVYAGIGMAVFVGGVAASRRCKQKRLSALINGTQPRGGNAN